MSSQFNKTYGVKFFRSLTKNIEIQIKSIDNNPDNMDSDNIRKKT